MEIKFALLLITCSTLCYTTSSRQLWSNTRDCYNCIKNSYNTDGWCKDSFWDSGYCCSERDYSSNCVSSSFQNSICTHYDLETLSDRGVDCDDDTCDEDGIFDNSKYVFCPDDNSSCGNQYFYPYSQNQKLRVKSYQLSQSRVCWWRFENDYHRFNELKIKLKDLDSSSISLDIYSGEYFEGFEHLESLTYEDETVTVEFEQNEVIHVVAVAHNSIGYDDNVKFVVEPIRNDDDDDDWDDDERDYHNEDKDDESSSGMLHILLAGAALVIIVILVLVVVFRVRSRMRRSQTTRGDSNQNENVVVAVPANARSLQNGPQLVLDDDNTIDDKPRPNPIPPKTGDASPYVSQGYPVNPQNLAPSEIYNSYNPNQNQNRTADQIPIVPDSANGQVYSIYQPFSSGSSSNTVVVRPPSSTQPNPMF